MRGLRGTKLDLFGYHSDRKLERQLRDEYQQLIEQIAGKLTSSNYKAAIELAQLPAEIRGFGPVKEQAVEASKVKSEQLLAQLQ